MSSSNMTFKRDNSSLIADLKIKGISNNNVLEAIKKVPRELFVKKQYIGQAYENIPLPIDCEQTISQPYVVAFMIACLNIKKNYRILEIGTGSGYQTAILSHLCKEIYAIEIYDQLLNEAKKKFLKLNLNNIKTKSGDGAKGWDDKILFDGIIVSAASKNIPTELWKNLKDQGYLIIPKSNFFNNQKLIMIKKSNKNYIKKELFDVKFVPLLKEKKIF